MLQTPLVADFLERSERGLEKHIRTRIYVEQETLLIVAGTNDGFMCAFQTLYSCPSVAVGRHEQRGITNPLKERLHHLQ